MSSRLQETTRRYNFSAGQTLSLAGSAVRSTPILAQEIMVSSTVRCWIKVGGTTVAATAGAGSMQLAPDEKFHLQLGNDQYISVIQDSVAGTAIVVPVAV